MGSRLRSVNCFPWGLTAVTARLPVACCRAYSQSHTSAKRGKAAKLKSEKKGSHREDTNQKQGVISRTITAAASLRLQTSVQFYHAEDQLPEMAKTKQRARRAREGAEAAALMGDSMASQFIAPFQHAESQQQNIPYLSVWPGTNQMLDPNAFASGFVHQLPQAMQKFDPFSMALAQPNLYSGLQPLPLPDNVPNLANLSFGSSQPGLSQPGTHFTSVIPSDQQFQQDATTQPIQAYSSNTPLSPPPSSAQQDETMAPKSSRVLAAQQKAARDRGRETISTPSAASGGVPNPTPAYLMRASFLPQRRPNPGPLLVVIDLNGTVLYRPSRKNSTSFRTRNHAEEFIRYCINTFWVVIWSSARPENVRRMVAQLLPPEALRQVVAVWGRDRFGLTQSDYNSRTQCYKRLTTLWNDPLVKSAYPHLREGFEGGCWDQGNTVLIDDSAEKARSEPYNAITLPEFMGDAEEQGDILPRVHDYLNELCYHEDVSAYMRANSFKMA
ncbi:HAD-like domain-containing protein [Coniella lustricola]|uniref:Mitochondrial import inner membrane translocase subunit TIM50 n=1 Tax=Coniella lustricola TaxID=2025994 RepID=A0A2T3ALC0_9PEZI|nr:HAD-like domain-containing protein [Coniella lustricola]